MTFSQQEIAQRQRFDDAYRLARASVMRTIERRVCGCDYGGTSWTTRVEAKLIREFLGLRPGLQLLDLGAGSGWPGLYLARESGCDLVLLDLPLSGLRIAAERAAADGLADHTACVLADAGHLPLQDASFDALSHSDLLCCLLDKRAVLKACRRVIRPDGSMVFSVISVAPGLSGEDRKRAIENGPEFIESDTSYPDLLAETGWIIRECRDLTRNFLVSRKRQYAADRDHKAALVELLGPKAFSERFGVRLEKIAALEAGLLRRELFVVEPARG
jgi:ubiquinone/menaquinone biosynthesis C-methylase UbiE